MTAAARTLLLAAMLLPAACSETEDTPEAQIRGLVEAAVEAAEQRSDDELAAMLHRDYRDARGYNRERLVGLLRLYFLRHKNIHLFTRIERIELLDDNRATVDLHVAMAGSAISGVDALARLRAQIYRFELQLVRDQQWMLQYAHWAPANAAQLRE